MPGIDIAASACNSWMFPVSWKSLLRSAMFAKRVPTNDTGAPH